MVGTSELRRQFLDFFQARGHEIVPSSSLIPANDPTLLFTNAGMVQFKDVFLGREKRSYKRAVTSQRCVRAGGKHNDLENVGYTARHHTFFEMLGNFSFGDYFKEEGIGFAWEFLTGVLKLPAEQLWVTIFEDDDEAADIWLKQIGIDPSRFGRIGAKDNFWQMGDTGPCGPCSEIFYDHGPDVAGGPPGSSEEDGDRYVEIWNLVFMQYDRAADGALTPLPKPCVDTGMGLERLAAVMQGVHSNYETDLFVSLLQAAAKLADTSELDNSSLRVIADHIRSCSFLIVDGVLPSNDGRGYVLRRIIRRAARHGHRLGLREPFFYQLVEPLIGQMGEAYPELAHAREQVESVLLQEEQRFSETLEHGLKILEEDIKGVQGSVIPGETVFRLYDTYGFPLDLTADIARERGLQLDHEGFERAMDAQRQRARAASQFGLDLSARIELDHASEFCGYDRLEYQGRVVALYRDGERVGDLGSGQEGLVVLDSTPFYAESGGQVGDQGEFRGEAGVFEVSDTQKQGDTITHIGRMGRGALAVGDRVKAEVDGDRRGRTVLNHSATHLLHAALRAVLGSHVQQRGSLVDPEHLRFDFSHPQPLTPEEVRAIEEMVNDQIRLNGAAQAREMSMEDALASGAVALFGEKYGDRVRVLSIGDTSTELCGGTHVRRAGDIGLFKIVSETGIASGVRRIEALTGERALERVRQDEEKLSAITQLLKAGREDVDLKVEQLTERARRLEKELEQLKLKLASQTGEDFIQQAVEVDGLKVLAARLDGVDSKTLRDTMDQVKHKLGSAAVVLGAIEGGKVRLVAGVSKDQTGRLQAGDLVNSVAQKVGGRGGGRPDMAQAGGDKPDELDNALAGVFDWVRERLTQTSS